MEDGISDLNEQTDFMGLEWSEAEHSEDERSASPIKSADGSIRQDIPDPEWTESW